MKCLKKKRSSISSRSDLLYIISNGKRFKKFLQARTSAFWRLIILVQLAMKNGGFQVKETATRHNSY